MITTTVRGKRKPCIIFTRTATKWGWVTCSVGLKTKQKKKSQQDSLYSTLTISGIVIFFFPIYMLEKIVMQQHCCCEYSLAGTFAFKTLWSDWFLLKIAEVPNKAEMPANWSDSRDGSSKPKLPVGAGISYKASFGLTTYLYSKKKKKKEK